MGAKSLQVIKQHLPSRLQSEMEAFAHSRPRDHLRPQDVEQLKCYV